MLGLFLKQNHPKVSGHFLAPGMAAFVFCATEFAANFANNESSTKI